MQLDFSAIIVIVIAFIALGLLWRVITGMIRLVVTLVVIGVVAYALWSFFT